MPHLNDDSYRLIAKSTTGRSTRVTYTPPSSATTPSRARCSGPPRVYSAAGSRQTGNIGVPGRQALGVGGIQLGPGGGAIWWKVLAPR